MDSESLDRCIQTALSALYPPFQATSPTVLCQVLNVVERCYRGDGLRYLIHFLLPAKQFLQNLQQDACSPYCGLLFRHEGWPLCIHDRIVVQLCHLDQRLLRPGDFYLLISPPPPPPKPRGHSASCRGGVGSSPHLLVCSLSAGGRHVEEQEVSDIALRSLFSMSWLDSVNRDRERRGASRMERCLLSSHGDVFRVPWEDLVYPQFMTRPRMALKDHKETPGKDGNMLINTSHDRSVTQDNKLLPSSVKANQTSSEESDSEGEYVELTELPLPRFSPQKGSLTQSISQQHRARTSAHTPQITNTHTPQTANAHTLQATNTHTLQTANTHTPQTTNTHTTAHTPQIANTHTPPSSDISSHTSFCSRLLEENLDLDLGPDGAVILTPIAPVSSPSSSFSVSPPGDGDTSRCEWEQTEGTESGRSKNLETEMCTEQGGKEEEEIVELMDEGVDEKVEVEDLDNIQGKMNVDVGKTGSTKDEVLYSEEEEEEDGEELDEDDEEVEVEEEVQEDTQTQHTHSEDTQPQHTHSEDTQTQHTHSEDTQTQHTHSEENGVHLDPYEESENGLKNHGVKEQKKRRRRRGRRSGPEDVEEEDQSCEEVGGGTSAELHTEGPSAAQSQVSLSTCPSPTEPEPEPPVSSSQPVQSVRTPRTYSVQLGFYKILLRSGVLCLPGTRDRSGRALLTVCTRNAVWSNPDCDSAELLRLLLYYTSTLRKDVAALGLTVLVDARRAPPAPALFAAFRSLQENIPGSIHTVFLLMNKDSSVRLDKPSAVQVEVLSSLKSVQKHVELRHLPPEYGGSFSFSQSSWLCYRSRVEHLTNQCEDVINLLQKTINILESTPLPSATEDAERLLSKYKTVMRSILEDSRLVQLQQEGGASLSRLRREESSISVTEDYRAAVEAVSGLYDQVDELLHRLVTLSNSRTQELQFIIEFSGLEEGFGQVKTWMEQVGEVRLKSLDEPEDSLDLMNKKQQDFKEFYSTAYDWCQRGETLLSRLDRWDNISSSDLQVYEVKVHSFWAQVQDFSQRVNATGQNIDRAVRLYRFLDQAYGWALEGMRHLAGISMEECTLPEKCQAVIGCLDDYHSQHPPIPDARFQEMKALAGELRGERGLRQWSFAWSKCQETKKMFDRKMETALRMRDSAHRRRSDSEQGKSSTSFSRKTLSGLWGIREAPPSPSPSSDPPEEDAASLCAPSTPSPPRNASTPLTSTPSSSAAPPHTPQHTPLLQRLFRSTSSDESSDRVDICSSTSSLHCLDSTSFTTPSTCSFNTTSSGRRQQLRKTQSFDCPSTPEVSRFGPCPRTLSEPVRRGNTGVFIRGLEVSSTEAADRTLCPRSGAQGWAGHGPRSPGTPGTPRTPSSTADPRPRGSKLRHIVEEMVTTEREYVRSLSYIIRHYFPEMDRADVPQDLRGKRSVVFGNLEKLLDFHSQFFLKELEACWKHPLRVPHCFLRHREQFGLYALYSKNKPKSDALLANRGNSFFRRKQVELGDKMDLSSYLLKPIQRMSKYALLLTDLIKEVGVSQEAELTALHAATNMVKFQLRHGNDLLAMDAIRDCDVNLKEQGQLIRQDEFTVWSGRRKCQRHIFLFEELVLFSKPKRVEGGLDVFIYKHSFKTADVGLTESAGDKGLRFEIWFRRRTSKNQTFILQASTQDVKVAWTSDIARILWTQATRNKEMRLKEMVSMGVGNKPFLDIQPSDAAISDRAVHYIMKSRGARTRASIAVSVFDHSNPFKRSAVTSDPAASGPLSSSLLGPLNLHMYSQSLPSPPPAEGSFIASCIEEDEQEHETSSQPSMTTESSGSSSRCLSGSTGSDSGCVSSHLQEALPEEPSPPSQPSSSSSSSSSNALPSNKQHLSNQYISANSTPVISPATIV
ncbi:puratrophin-1 [Sphaeramia orbicularis]|uniref:puratrophin-1 n=1 Tax=Sphaeramia orbicularis TaxID=375764 RepID=UPI001180FB67|nr:puratrophin-1-like [Sphaeramia orbicularis]